jgi:hypothetical protein
MDVCFHHARTVRCQALKTLVVIVSRRLHPTSYDDSLTTTATAIPVMPLLLK